MENLQHHVTDILAAGYPAVDPNDISPQNPLAPTPNSFDLRRPYESLTAWRESVTADMPNTKQCQWTFGATMGMHGRSAMTREAAAGVLKCDIVQVEQMLRRVEHTALRYPYRQELLPLINNLTSVVASKHVINVERLIRLTLLRGELDGDFAFAIPFVKWLSAPKSTVNFEAVVV
jgi:hypothetical protein